ncbi:MAG TPA: PEP/pyruvate-binding domain-containing protein, partial [Anaerolineales bacterium]|nr:PEP/pyruvate-binding domain-containing protein [Anaerolineales bacterium]
MSFDPTEFPKVLTLYLAISQYPILGPRIRDRMRQELFKRGVIRPEAFEAEVVEKAIQSQRREGITDPLNQDSPETWQRRIAIVRDNLTDFYFAYNLPHERFEQILKDMLSSRLPHQDVVLTIHPELAPWDMLFAQGEAYEALSDAERAPVEHHLTEIKVVLIKTMLSDHLPYLGIAKDWFDIKDLKSILAKRIGRGKIGGKAAGLMLAQNILRKSAKDVLLQDLRFPRSWFLGADVFYQFNQMNNLYTFANQKYKDEHQVRSEHPSIQRDFMRGAFSEDIITGLRDLLKQADTSPLIVRSSSLLED